MTERPDILWIVTTQWRASAAGYAGDPNARTPCLDALAAESVNYAQAVTPHPFGPFARAALLTGRPSPENGVRDYFDPLPADTRTIAHELRELGYATAFFGKWHLSRRDPTAALVGEAHAKTVIPQEERGGFEFWEGFESGFLLNDPWLHGTRLPEPKKIPGYQSDVLCERAVEWLGELRTSRGELRAARESEEIPFFTVVSLESPHPPYDAPSAGTTGVSAAEIVLPANVPRGGQEEARARKELAGYYAHIEATDRAIGKLVSAVKEQAERAGRGVPVIVFTSVHGDMHGAHGLFRKGWPYEESVRVPLLVRGTREFSSEFGVRSLELVSLIDLPRWTLEWAGRIKPEVRNSKPEIECAPQRISMPSVVALPHQCDRMWRGVRTKTRKLVLDERGEPWLFFDLENDPLEMKNLVGDPAWTNEIETWRARVNESTPK